MDILVVNAGSTSLKLHLVDERERSRPLDEGQLAADAQNAAAVAHRVVHGGARYRGPVLIDALVLERLYALETLAPLHNAPALRGIELARAAVPHVPHVAVFDTAFHGTMPEQASMYALPRRLREDFGVSRYGFHGLSVQWSAEQAARMLASDSLRLVVCHLGGGCSVSAVRAGRSLDTTMGFSPLEGVPMATRSGSVDPGAVVYLLRERGMSLEELEHVLNFESGLQALGGTADMAELERRAAAHDTDARLAEHDTDARLAIELFAYRVAAAAAAMAVAAGGIDALVFTAGIGEHAELARERICDRLRFLGVRLDATRNSGAQPGASQAGDTQAGGAQPDDTQQGDSDIAAQGSAVRVLVIRAREELIAARAARGLLSLKKDRPAGGSGPIRGRE